MGKPGRVDGKRGCLRGLKKSFAEIRKEDDVWRKTG
jgi:hypothetical protein